MSTLFENVPDEIQMEDALQAAENRMRSADATDGLAPDDHLAWCYFHSQRGLYALEDVEDDVHELLNDLRVRWAHEETSVPLTVVERLRELAAEVGLLRKVVAARHEPGVDCRLDVRCELCEAAHLRDD